MSAPKICSIEGCGRPAPYRTWCRLHYRRWRIHGDPLITLVVHGQDEMRWDRFVDRHGPVAKNHPELGSCWVWNGSCNKWGYGKFTVAGRTVAAHRWGYQHHVGPIPEGMDLDHFACDRRECVNPCHLRPATPRENGLRNSSPIAAFAAAEGCVNGHPFDEANTYLRPGGGRTCRECARGRMRKARAR